jgi:hypothetical protein
MSTTNPTSFTERNVALAKACGLEMDRLRCFTLQVQPNREPVVHATYVLPEGDELVPLLRLFTLVEDITHVELPEPPAAPKP